MSKKLEIVVTCTICFLVGLFGMTMYLYGEAMYVEGTVEKQIWKFYGQVEDDKEVIEHRSEFIFKITCNDKTYWAYSATEAMGRDLDKGDYIKAKMVNGKYIIYEYTKVKVPQRQPV